MRDSVRLQGIHHINWSVQLESSVMPPRSTAATSSAQVSSDEVTSAQVIAMPPRSSRLVSLLMILEALRQTSAETPKAA